MKNLEEVDDEYNEAFEEEVEAYHVKLAAGKNKKKVQDEFHRNLARLIARRNSDSLKYIKKNKVKLLGMPVKKVKKKKELGVYKASHIDFRRSFLVNTKMFFSYFTFRSSLILRSIYYNFIPSRLKFVLFRIGLFLSSVWFDVKMFFTSIGRSVSRIFSRIFESVKDSVVKVVVKLKRVTDKFKEKYTKYQEEKKKKKEAAELVKKEAEEKKKKDAEEKKRQEQEATNPESDKSGNDKADGKAAKEVGKKVGKSVVGESVSEASRKSGDDMKNNGKLAVK